MINQILIEKQIYYFIWLHVVKILIYSKKIIKKIILIDRFVDSTIAYQHYGFGIDLNLINLINSHILKRFKVDFTFLNIIDKKYDYET